MKNKDLKEEIAKLINDNVDWAEWCLDDEEGKRIAVQILSTVYKHLLKKMPKADLANEWMGFNHAIFEIKRLLKEELLK